MINIIIADDQTIILDGLKALFTADTGIQVVATAQNGEEALALLQQHSDIDVAVLDIEMPKLNGIETTRRLKQAHEGIGVLILSMYKKIQYILATQNAGADGYLLKDTNKDELVHAIKEIAAEEIYFGREIMEIEKKYKRGRVKEPKLTNKEKEVLKLIAIELTSQEIGHRLGIKPSTVDTHRKHLKSKLEVKSSIGLAVYAVKQGLISEEIISTLELEANKSISK